MSLPYLITVAIRKVLLGTIFANPLYSDTTFLSGIYSFFE